MIIQLDLCIPLCHSILVHNYYVSGHPVEATPTGLFLHVGRARRVVYFLMFKWIELGRK